jgi:hypothetical protein
MTTEPMGRGEDGLRWKRILEGEIPRSLTLPRNDGAWEIGRSHSEEGWFTAPTWNLIGC